MKIPCLALLATLVASPVHAVIMGNFGSDPTSGAGTFNASVGGGPFDHQYLFRLTQPVPYEIAASLVNVFPAGTDRIIGLEVGIFRMDGEVLDRSLGFLLRGLLTTPCAPLCQQVSRQFLIEPGNYFLDVAGIGGGTSGYGGDLSTRPTPLPVMGSGLMALVLGAFVALRWRFRSPGGHHA